MWGAIPQQQKKNIYLHAHGNPMMAAVPKVSQKTNNATAVSTASSPNTPAPLSNAQTKTLQLIKELKQIEAINSNRNNFSHTDQNINKIANKLQVLGDKKLDLDPTSIENSAFNNDSEGLKPLFQSSNSPVLFLQEARPGFFGSTTKAYLIQKNSESGEISSREVKFDQNGKIIDRLPNNIKMLVSSSRAGEGHKLHLCSPGINITTEATIQVDSEYESAIKKSGFDSSKITVQYGTPYQSAQAAMQKLFDKQGINKKVGEGFGENLANYHVNAFGQDHAPMRGAVLALNKPILFIKENPMRINFYNIVSGKMVRQEINPDDIKNGNVKLPYDCVCLYKTADGKFATIDKKDNIIEQHIDGSNKNHFDSLGINTKVKYNNISPRESARQSLQTVFDKFGDNNTERVGDVFADKFANMNPNDTTTARTICRKIGRPFAVVDGDTTHLYTINKERKLVHTQFTHTKDQGNIPYNTVVFVKDPKFGIGLTGDTGELKSGNITLHPKSQQTVNFLKNLGFNQQINTPAGTAEDSAHNTLNKLTGLKIPTRAAHDLNNYRRNAWFNSNKLFETLTKTPALKDKPILFVKDAHDGEPTRAYIFERDKNNKFTSRELQLNDNDESSDSYSRIQDKYSIPENAVAIAKIDGKFGLLENMTS